MIQVVGLALVIIYILLTDLVIPLVKGKGMKVGNPISLRDLLGKVELLYHDVQELKIRLALLENQLKGVQLWVEARKAQKSE